MNHPTISTPRPQILPLDQISNNNSFEPIFPNIPMPGHVSSNSPPYEDHAFLPEVPPRIPAKTSPAFNMDAKRGGGQNSSIGSFHMSSDDADSMSQTRRGNE